MSALVYYTLEVGACNAARVAHGRWRSNCCREGRVLRAILCFPRARSAHTDLRASIGKVCRRRRPVDCGSVHLLAPASAAPLDVLRPPARAASPPTHAPACARCLPPVSCPAVGQDVERHPACDGQESPHRGWRYAAPQATGTNRHKQACRRDTHKTPRESPCCQCQVKRRICGGARPSRSTRSTLSVMIGVTITMTETRRATAQRVEEAHATPETAHATQRMRAYSSTG
jgi:hypothetical protein